MNAPTHDDSSFESPLDAERVEWVPASPDTVEVRVVGRWRVVPPTAAPTLLVEVIGERQRFPAVEHGMAGAVWRATYLVPIELRPRLEGRLALAVGAAEIGLPPAVPGPADEGSAPPPATVVDRTVLAERRARRAELAEESLVRRAGAAEATAATLRTQLEHLEERLREAVAERERLGRDLRAAEQREEAERRVRFEVSEERGQAEQQIRELRARLRAAHDRAAELEAELEAVRRDGDEAQQAAEAARHAAERALDDAREREAQAEERLRELEATEAQLRADRDEFGGDAAGVRAGLDRLRDEALELTRVLESERAERAEAELALAGERDRLSEAEATVAMLQGQLERRAEIQASVHGELAQMRADLEGVRDRAGSGGGDPAAEAALRARLADLEMAERAVRDELEAAQAELGRARAELDRVGIDAAAARATEAALREAERAAIAIRREAAEAHARLEEERRRRFEVEATLRAQLEREREAFGAQIAMAEGTLRAQLGEQRRAFEAQVGAVERLVGELRERLALAAAQLEARLAQERTAREQAERRSADLARELERASAERSDRGAIQEQVAGLRTQLEALRADAQAREAREAAVQRLVAELLQTAGRVREGFEGELRELQDELTAQIDSERAGARRQLEAVEDRVAELRAELERERMARRIAEAEVERARGSVSASAGEIAPAHPATLAYTQRELAAEEETPPERTPEELRAEAEAMIRNLEDAGMRLRAQREALEAAEVQPEVQPEPEVAPQPEPEVEEPAAEAPAAEITPEPAPAPQPARAPSAWTATGPRPRPAASTPTGPAPAPVPVPAAPEAVAPGPEAVEAAPEAEAEVDAAAETHVEAPEPAAEAAPAFIPPAGTQLLRPRVVAPAGRRDTPWLRDALATLAAADPDVAERLVQALLAARPAEAAPEPFGLLMEGLGSFRAAPGADPTAVDDLELRLAGPAAALAPFVAGGAGRRLKGVKVEGSRRRARALLRTRRRPVTLADLVAAGAAPDPDVALRALAAAIDPAWTAGHGFTIAFQLAAAGGAARHTVTARDGEALAVDAEGAGDAPGTVVEVDRVALVPLLARLAPPPGGRALVHGDAQAHALFLSWTDRVQGIGEPAR